ncbi:MAG TPA: HupE/UreJ family protein, partial [Gammaproteobacteria bacterium]|nr:HupE/UreJ family protein [Gammaproteobacteria bacterium]
LVAVAAAALASVARAHEVPSDVTVRMLVRPEGERLKLLVRAPLEAMQDITFPLVGPGYLDVPRAESQLRDAARLWLADNVDLYEGDRRLPLAIVAVRASIPSDRSFAEYDAALAHLHAAPLPAGLDLPWQQALLDVELEAPIESPTSLFSISARTGRLGMRVVNAVRFFGASGVERVFQIEGNSGLVALDPRWHQSMLRFLVQGFEHILSGADHLLFLLALVVPFRRELRKLVWIVTAFTGGHSVTLIASAYGVAPSALWFPPLVETLIALSIFYMCVENVVCPNPRTRWPLAFAFGLVHGFGFSFALQNTLQFAGDHVLTSLLSFNVGIELGQLLVLAAVVPALNLLFRFVDGRIGGIVIAVIVGHTAWHWLGQRFDALSAFFGGWHWPG